MKMPDKLKKMNPGTLKKLLPFLKKRWPLLALSLLLAAGTVVIQLYVPDAIIFGGGQCREDGYLYRRTLEEIRNILPRERLENIKVSITTLGKYQSALGAARLAYEKFFGETKKDK